MLQADDDMKAVQLSLSKIIRFWLHGGCIHTVRVHEFRKPAGQLLGGFTPKLSGKARRSLEKLGVEVRLHTAVASVERDRVTFAEGSVLASHTMVWAAGVRPHPLADQLGISFLPGTVVDATGQMFGVSEPTFAIVTGYPRHEITREMNAVTVFPEVAALETAEAGEWTVLPLLTTLERSWTELGELEGEIRFDQGTDEHAGPLDIGVVLTRTLDVEGTDTEQRVMVIGDGDFLSNTYLGNAGNLGLGLQAVHWLSHDDAFIDIRVRTAPDATLVLTNTARGVIGFGFLLGLPLLLLLSGLVIWLRRRRR